MYFNILKKDLKRKKTMNIILLLFIILATTFVSSSVNNMIAVTTALDSYFEKAGMDGLAVCREIRETSNAPIIIVSAKTEKDDKLNGLLLGADDYIEKPYDIDILLAKIHGIFKRRYQTLIITDGYLKIDKTKRVAYKKDEPLDLTQKEFDLLSLLMENTGKTMSKDMLFNKIWGFDSFSEPQTLTVHIKWLRQKIEDNPKNPQRIVTVWGVGYRYEQRGDAT